MICLRMGKTYMTKTPSVTSKGIPIPYTNLQLNPYPNTQLDLFCSDNLSFQCTTPSTWLTNSMRGSQYTAYSSTREGCWLQSFSIHHTMKITKLLGYKTLRYTNTIASWIERWTRAYVSGSQYACEKLFQWVASTVMALKTVLIYV